MGTCVSGGPASLIENPVEFVMMIEKSSMTFKGVFKSEQHRTLPICVGFLSYIWKKCKTYAEMPFLHVSENHHILHLIHSVFNGRNRRGLKKIVFWS